MLNIIDRDIARLEESIRVLRSRRNELSPIYRLPAEILCNIFSLTEDLSRVRSPKSWTNFSQVSQRWRSSALSAPQLWTKISLNYSRWAQEMLIRSKMAKLTVRSDLSFDNSNHWLCTKSKTIETVRSCLYEMNRVEEINLTTFSELEEIFRDLPKSAPQLHTLCIVLPRFRSFRRAFSIHEDFLYNTERLQRVELSDCKISWDSPLLTGLTRLTLEDSLNADSSFIQVLHALQRMPALTELRLIYSIPDGSGGASTYPVVDLPSLRILHIRSYVSSLTTFLRHITFPHSAILDLTCLVKPTQESFIQIDLPNFLSVLDANFLSSLVIRSLQVTLRNSGLEFNLSTTEFIHGYFQPSSTLFSQSQLQLSLVPIRSNHHNYGKILTSAFDALSLPFLTQLLLSSLSCIDSRTWVETFGRLPLLERVYVKSSAPNSFLEALVYKTEADEKSKTACSVSLPKLRIIHLSGTFFDSPRFIRSPRSSVSVEKLLDHLMERWERKAQVQVLCLDDCYYISSGDVERLKEIVDVIWDGVEQEEESEDESR
jgi:F-box-like